MGHRTLLPILLAITPGIAIAQTSCRLVADLNQQPRPFSSAPRSATTGPGGTLATSLVQLGAAHYFVATAPDTGEELWRTDGTASGTRLVKDINTGPDDAAIAFLTVCNGRLWFRATDKSSGAELWTSDGTTAGTRRVTDLRAGAAGSNPASLCCLGTRLIFVADAGTGTAVWQTDGTASNTTPLRPLRSATDLAIAVGGTWIYFRGDDGTNGAELWRTDGTVSGTVLLKDIHPGATASNPTDFVNANGVTLFRARDRNSDYELWKTGGTRASTVRVKDIRAGTSGSHPALGHSQSVVLGTFAYFSAYDPNHGSSLFRSDGSTAGTQRLTDGGSPTAIATFGGKVWFSMDSKTLGTRRGHEPHSYDPVTRTWTRLLDIVPGKADSYPSAFTAAGNVMFFTAMSPTSGRELWITDGTAANTRQVVDLNPGAGHGSPDWLTASGTSRVLFFGTNHVNETELYHSSGSASGTVRIDLTPMQVTAGAAPDALTSIAGNQLLFHADDGQYGREPWLHDRSGTRLLRDIRSGSASSDPADFTSFWNGTRLLTVFRATTDTHGEEVWITDGTGAGTRLVRDIASGAASSNPRDFVALGRRVFFSATDGASPGMYGRELWVTDGTANGTQLVVDLVRGASSSEPESLVACGARIFFVAGVGRADRELWITDGSPGGTRRVIDLHPGTASSSPSFLTSCRNQVVFRATTASGGELWASDGTASGTRVLLDRRPGSSHPINLARVGDVVFFSAISNQGTELWATDLTPSGTRLVKDLVPGSGSGFPMDLTAAQGRLFFTAQTAAAGRELWISDGTAAGTHQVADIEPGARSSAPQGLVAGGGGVFFSATLARYPAPSGAELWFSDGTANGTRRVCDIEPGSRSSEPASLTVARGNVYFTAATRRLGRELYTLATPPATVEHLPADCGSTRPRLECTDARLGTTAHITGLDAPTASRLLIVGAPPGSPASIGGLVHPDCPVWLDLRGPLEMINVPTSGSTWQVTATVPNQSALLGARFALQTFFAPLPGVLSNGLAVQVGR